MTIGDAAQLLEEGAAAMQLTARHSDSGAGARVFDVIVIGGGQAGSRSAITSRARACGSSSSMRTTASGIPGASAGTRCACSRRPKFDGLDGLRFPAPRNHFPTKDEMAGLP